jgi:uncharacterized protein (UPF0332 family)
MKTRDEHLQQARSNQRHAESLVQTARVEDLTWAVTVFYYAAAHYGRAFLVERGVTTITTHGGFATHFARQWRITPDIFPLYQELQDRSEAGRYDCIAYSQNEVEDLRDHYYWPFRDAICTALGIIP